MNILVTGGAGFIASHIVDSLIEAGHAVSVMDDLSTGSRANLNGSARFFEGDLTVADLASLFTEVRPEVVIHHAAQIDVQASIRNPERDAAVNIVGTIRLLEQCAAFGVRKLLYASSAAVYGVPETSIIKETHPLRPISCYGLSKLTPERYIELFSTLYGLDYTILRYANVYGTRQDPKGEGGVVSVFLQQLLTGKHPVIFGTGEQTRDFIYVKDIAAANLAALQRGSAGIFNIGSSRPTTVNELLRRMCELMGQPYVPVYGPARPGDILHSRLDNQAALDHLHWAPRYDLDAGLMETLDYYSRQRKLA
ncbi:NAD-dependent epimerase/dehydratase family protein [Gorillibacterium sp. sgz5001074]|uniref:NAD-dependent epimerase/dehydratase family protein n=1 Tax=Gorillibacterium sp. sgz5001074 TaxID=3446695 RepID=UPI003F67640F